MPTIPASAASLVRTIAESRRTTLDFAGRTRCILGMPSSEGWAPRDALFADATAPQFISTLCWQVNDLVMWHNRGTRHRGTPFDDLHLKRDVQRATVSDVAVSCAQGGAWPPK